MIAIAAVAASVMAAWGADHTISANYTLSSDEMVDGILTVASGVTVDLAGHKLTVEGLGTAAGTITSSSSGGVLEVNVSDGASVNNSAIALAGGTNLQVLKTGSGSLVMSKVNTGFGGVGATSVVVRAGILRRASASTNSAYDSLGAEGSVVVVEDGAALDLVGRGGWKYDYVVSGSGPDGTGVLVSNTSLSDPWTAKANYGFVNKITLAGDATFGGTGMWGLIKSQGTAYAPLTVDMGTPGNTLTIAGKVYLGAAHFVGNGKIIVASDASILTAGYTNIPSGEDCDVMIRTGGTLNFYNCGVSPLKSLVFDGGTYSMGGNNVNYVTTVYDTYAPNLPVNVGSSNYHPHPRVALGKSGEMATLDLSRFSTAFPNYDSAKNVVLTTFTSANVNVYTGSRDIRAGDVLMTWNAAPSAEFSLVCAGQSAAERKLGLKPTATGLVIISTSRPDYAVRDVVNSEWKFYSYDDTLLTDWEGGIDGEMAVRFSSYAEYEAVKALASGISPRGYVMHDFVLPAGGASYDCRNGLSFSLVSADVNGGTLILPATTVAGAEAGATVTSSAAGGTLEICVENGENVTNRTIAISGGANMKLAKSGAGTLTMGLQNIGFGASGATSVVVRAGILRRATASTDSAYNSLGAEGSVVVVENGAALDLVGRGGWKYDYVVSGFGPDGAGVLVSNTSLTSPWDAKAGFGFVNKITLAGDATFGGTEPWGLVKAQGTQGTAYAPLAVNMGSDGNTLVITGTYYLGAAQFIGKGEIVVANGASLCTAGYSNLPNATGCVIRVSNGATFYSYNKTIGTVKSLVFETSATNKFSNDSGWVFDTITVYDTYAPNLPENKIGNTTGDYLAVKLGEVGHLATTLDLSRHIGSFNAYNTEFHAGSTVTVNLAGRTNLWAFAKSENPYAITWTAATRPAASVTFVLDAMTRKLGYKCRVTDEGLRLIPPIGIVIFVR